MIAFFRYERVRKIGFWIGNFSCGFYEEFRNCSEVISDNITDISNNTVNTISRGGNLGSDSSILLPNQVKQVTKVVAGAKALHEFGQSPVGSTLKLILIEANPTTFL
jgi:hypothetical protein